MLTYLELAWNGNYIGRILRLEYWQHNGRIYVLHQQQPNIITETQGTHLTLGKKNLTW